MKDLWKLLLSIGISLSAGLVGSLATAPVILTWYDALNKPALNPPNWIFAPVWTSLYVLIGISLYIVWTTRPTRAAMVIFSTQLSLNVLWPVAFFGWQNPLAGLIVIALLWLAILLNIISFYRISKPAAYLLVPYLLWVTFAGYLNYSIWLLN